MLLTRDNLPETIPDIAALDDLLCRPSQALIDDLAQGRRRHHDPRRRRQDGADAGRPCQGRPARPPRHRRRALQRCRRRRTGCEARGIETINCDLLDEAAIEALPKAPNIVFMAGRKFGAEGDLSLTWAMNAHVPALVAQAFAGFADRGVLDRLRLSVRAGRTAKAPTKTCAPNPPGEYAQSCVGRERMFEYFSRKFSTPGRLFRLNYAIDMRYGVLHDIASKVLQGKPIDVSLGHVNFIWQGDASAQALRCLAHCDTPTSPINVSGHEILAVRDLAAKFGALLRPRARHRRQGRADGVAHRHLAGGQTVRPADRRHRATDRLDRGLGRARRCRASASPPNTRCAMADTEHVAIVELGVGRRARPGLRCRPKRTGTRTRPTGASS